MATSHYRTRRLSEAALLLCLGFQFHRIEPTAVAETREFVFPADAAPAGARFYEEFGDNCNALSYSRALTDLKAAVYPRVTGRGRYARA